VAFTDASLFTASPTGESAPTTIPAGGAQATGAGSPTTNAGGATATGASPKATKSSAGELMVRVDVAGVSLPVFAMIWVLLGVQF